MIRIGTTVMSPEVAIPTVHNMKVCACQDNPVDKGKTQAFTCAASGRYLVLLMEKTDAFTLCEVELYEGNLYMKEKRATLA